MMLEQKATIEKDRTQHISTTYKKYSKINNDLLKNKNRAKMDWCITTHGYKLKQVPEDGERIRLQRIQTIGSLQESNAD